MMRRNNAFDYVEYCRNGDESLKYEDFSKSLLN